MRTDFFRKALLPFLLADSQVVIVGLEGVKVTPIDTIFDKKEIYEAPFVIIKKR